MKPETRLRNTLIELYWAAFSNGQVFERLTASGDEKFPVVTSPREEFNRKNAINKAFKKLSPPNPASSGRAQLVSGSGKHPKAKARLVRARR